MGVLSYRAPAEIIEKVDKAAADDGLSRSDWLASIVDRGLLGKGLLSADAVRERRDARREAADRLRSLGRGIVLYTPEPEDQD